MTAELTPDDLAAMRAKHEQVEIHGTPHCFACRNTYGFMQPGLCDAVRLLDEVARLRGLLYGRAGRMMAHAGRSEAPSVSEGEEGRASE